MQISLVLYVKAWNPSSNLIILITLVVIYWWMYNRAVCVIKVVVPFILEFVIGKSQVSPFFPTFGRFYLTIDPILLHVHFSILMGMFSTHWVHS